MWVSKPGFKTLKRDKPIGTWARGILFYLLQIGANDLENLSESKRFLELWSGAFGEMLYISL